MTPLFTAGTRPKSLQDEAGLYLTDFSVSAKRTHNDVIGVANDGDVPEVLYTEGVTAITEIKFTGMPIPTAGGLLQGIAALEDAAVITTLANLIDNEVFGIALSTGTMVSRDPEFKKARSGTGREFTFNISHFHAMN